MPHTSAKVLSLAAVTLLALACTPNGGAPAAVNDEDAGTSKPDAAVDVPPPLEITDLRYYLSATGPRLMVRGTATPSRPYALRVELLDAEGAAATIPAGDGPAEPTELEIDGTAVAPGRFFVEVVSAKGLESVVRRMAVTPRDASAHEGTRRVAELAPLPLRAAGEPCDADGFDVCAPSTVCAPGILGEANRCDDEARVRAERCAAGPVIATASLTPGAEGISISGVARGSSLWDPPDGCASAERRARPEGLVRLHVASTMPSLTLSTASPATRSDDAPLERPLDTVLYVLPGCPKTVAAALACNDDAPAPASKVVLRDLAPGDYVIVVDSLVHEGGAFTLRATVP